MCKVLYRIGFATLCTIFAAIVASAQTTTTQTYNFGPGLGTLTYTQTAYSRDCVSAYGNLNYTEYDYSGFSYSNPDLGISQPISGGTYLDYGVGNRYVGSGNCPPYPRGLPVTYTNTNNGGGYTITFAPAVGITISVPGYINPKYLVLGVIYAPPGPQSTVSYGSSSLESNTSSVSDTFANSSTFTISETLTKGIYAYVDGGLDSSSTVSSSSSQSTGSTTTSSVSVTKGSGVTDTAPGPSCAYVGADHDYDQIKLWLNPVLPFTLTGGSHVQWAGYGYSSLDTIANGGDLQVPDMDIQYVYVGCLNGDFDQLSPGYCNNQYGKAFSRQWAAVESWPSGQGPGLTGPGTTSGTDLNNIAQADPYWNCTYQSGETASACGFDSARYTRVDYNGSPLVPFPYGQAAPGGQPSFQTYNSYMTTASTTGQAFTQTQSQTFGWETKFSASLFKEGFSKTISQSTTMTSTAMWNNQFTSSNTTSATATIYEAPCQVVNGQCTPPYPSGVAYQPVACSALNPPTAFGQGTSFLLYLDNLFGTFMMLPQTY